MRQKIDNSLVNCVCYGNNLFRYPNQWSTPATKWPGCMFCIIIFHLKLLCYYSLLWETTCCNYHTTLWGRNIDDSLVNCVCYGNDLFRYPQTNDLIYQLSGRGCMLLLFCNIIIVCVASWWRADPLPRVDLWGLAVVKLLWSLILPSLIDILVQE